MCIWKGYIFASSWWKTLYISVKTIGSWVSFSATISLLILCLEYLSIVHSGVLKFPSINVLMSMSFLKSSKTFLIYLGVPMLGAYIFTMFIAFWWILPFRIMKWPSLSLFMAFVLFIFIFRERGRDEEERERNINVQLPSMCPLLGTWLTTQACAPNGNQTGDPFVCRLAFNSLSNISQGWPVFWHFAWHKYATLAFSPSICLEYFFLTLHFQSVQVFCLKWVSCRKHICGSCFLIHSATLCLSIGAFNLFTFKVINYSLPFFPFVPVFLTLSLYTFILLR